MLKKNGKNRKKTAPAAAAPGFSIGAEIERMIEADIDTLAGGYMNGTMSGESWKAFLQTVRDETIARLRAYRDGGFDQSVFRASTLQPYCEERMRIERDYLANLAALYASASAAYKSLTG